MPSRGDQLALRLANENDEKAPNELLREFFSGYPLDNLRALLSSENDVVVKNAAWIASELGRRAAPILDSVIPILSHGSRYARFFSIDVVRVCADEKDGAAIAAVVSKTKDPDAAVRWKSLSFLAGIGDGLLRQSISQQQDDHLRLLTAWICDMEKSKEDSEIFEQVLKKLESYDSLDRMFAAAASVRLMDRERQLLEIAAVSNDAEIASFSKEVIKKHRSRPV